MAVKGKPVPLAVQAVEIRKTLLKTTIIRLIFPNCQNPANSCCNTASFCYIPRSVCPAKGKPGSKLEFTVKCRQLINWFVKDVARFATSPSLPPCKTRRSAVAFESR